MPAYSFESITAAQAAAFRVTADTLSFHSTATPVSITVAYAASGATLTDQGRSVAFGSGVLGGAISFPDNAKLFLGSAGADVASGGAGGDQLLGGDGADALSGLDGNDALFGGGDNDTLSGGLGEDTLEGGRGDDLIDGGGGFDTLVYSNLTAGIFVNLETNHTISFDGLLGQDTLTGVENASGGAFNDVLFGDAGANRFSGFDGADSITGGAGDDTLDGGGGRDSITGGAGMDIIVGGLGVDLMEGGGELDVFEFRGATARGWAWSPSWTGSRISVTSCCSVAGSRLRPKTTSRRSTTSSTRGRWRRTSMRAGTSTSPSRWARTSRCSRRAWACG